MLHYYKLKYNLDLNFDQGSERIPAYKAEHAGNMLLLNHPVMQTRIVEPKIGECRLKFIARQVQNTLTLPPAVHPACIGIITA